MLYSGKLGLPPVSATISVAVWPSDIVWEPDKVAVGIRQVVVNDCKVEKGDSVPFVQMVCTRYENALPMPQPPV